MSVNSQLHFTAKIKVKSQVLPSVTTGGRAIAWLLTTHLSAFSPVSLTEAYPKLAPYRPPGQLISPPLLLSVILNVCFTIAMQTCGFLLVKKQPWYVALASWRWVPLLARTPSTQLWYWGAQWLPARPAQPTSMWMCCRASISGAVCKELGLLSLLSLPSWDEAHSNSQAAF